MTPSFEILLILGIVCFYLIDSAMLLYINEVVFIRLYDKWTFRNPRGNWRILGKMPYIPNPFTPNSPIFRGLWSSSPKQTSKCGSVESLLVALQPLGYLSSLLFGLQVFSLSLVVLLIGTGLEFFLVIGMIYSVICAMIAYIFFTRNQLGLSKKRALNLGFEMLTCPPFAINIVRKICMQYPFDIDAIDFAIVHLNNSTATSLFESVREKTMDLIDLEDDNSERRTALEIYNKKLSELNK